MSIPKIIHFIWTGSALKSIHISYMTIWKKKNPEYEVNIWLDGKEYFNRFYKEVVNDHTKFKGIKWLEWTQNSENAMVKQDDYYDFLTVAKRTITDQIPIQELIKEKNPDVIPDLVKIMEDSLIEMKKNKFKYAGRILREEVVYNGTVTSAKRNGLIVRDIRELFDDIKGSERSVENIRISKFFKIYLHEMYRTGNYAAASDLLRLIVLEKFGGIYVDIDLLPSLNFDVFANLDLGDNYKQIYGRAINEQIELNHSEGVMKGSRQSQASIDFLIEYGHEETWHNIKRLIDKTSWEDLYKSLPPLPEDDKIYSMKLESSQSTVSNAVLISNKNNGTIKEISNKLSYTYDFIFDNYSLFPKNRREIFAQIEQSLEKMDQENSSTMEIFRRLSLYADILIGYYYVGVKPGRDVKATISISGPKLILKHLQDTNDTNQNIDLFELDDISDLFSVEETAQSSWVISKDPNQNFIEAKKEAGIQLNDEEKRILERDLHPLSEDRIELWDEPITQFVDFEIKKSTINNTNYDSQLVIQLEGDQTSFESSKSLFIKNYDKSCWVQWNNLDKKYISWNKNKNNSVMESTLRDDFRLHGKVRISLVGHGRNKTALGNKGIKEISSILDNFFKKNNINFIDGITLNLVGCEIETSNSEAGLPYSLMKWLIKKSDNLNISRENLSVNSRKYLVAINNEGKKFIFNENYGWVNKDSSRLYDEFHKVQLLWDKQENRIIKSPASKQELYEMGKEIEAAIHHPKLSSSIRNKMQKTHILISRSLVDHYFNWRNHKKEPRSLLEKELIDFSKILDLSKEWSNLTKDLTISNEEKLLTIARKESDHNIDIQAINIKNGSSRWIKINNKHLLAFNKAINDKLNYLKKYFSLETDNNSLSLKMKDGISDIDAVHGLNTAFLFQSLIDMQSSEHTGYKRLSTALKIQTYVQLTQNSINVLDDASKAVKLVNRSLSYNFDIVKNLSKLNFLEKLGPGINVAMDVINIGSISFELSQAKDPVSEKLIKAKLGIAVINAGVNISSIGLAFLGASTASSILGVIAVPISGIAIGIPPLVENLSKKHESFKQGAKVYDAILKSISKPGFKKNDNVFNFDPIEVINKIDFDKNIITYGEVKSLTTTGGSWHTVTGGWDHYLAGPSASDRVEAIDIYPGLGIENKDIGFVSKDISSFLLPSGCSLLLTFEYDLVSGVRSASVPAYRALRKYHGTKFIWGYYATFFDYAITNVKVIYEETIINIYLDKKERSIIVPLIEDESINRLISYKIHGGGGKNILILNKNPVNININSMEKNEDEWFLNLDLLPKKDISGIEVTNNNILIENQNISYYGNIKKLFIIFSLSKKINLYMALADKRIFYSFDEITKEAISKIEDYYNSLSEELKSKNIISSIRMKNRNGYIVHTNKFLVTNDKENITFYKKEKEKLREINYSLNYSTIEFKYKDKYLYINLSVKKDKHIISIYSFFDGENLIISGIGGLPYSLGHNLFSISGNRSISFDEGINLVKNNFTPNLVTNTIYTTPFKISIGEKKRLVNLSVKGGYFYVKSYSWLKDTIRFLLSHDNEFINIKIENLSKDFSKTSFADIKSNDVKLLGIDYEKELAITLYNINSLRLPEVITFFRKVILSPSTVIKKFQLDILTNTSSFKSQVNESDLIFYTNKGHSIRIVDAMKMKSNTYIFGKRIDTYR